MNSIGYRRNFLWLFLILPAGLLACSLLTPARAAPTVQSTARAVAPTAAPSAQPSAAPTGAVVAPTTTAAATKAATAATAIPATAIPASPIPASPIPATPTTAPLQLQVVQSQIWTDPDGNVRANFLLRNPYAFPVAPTFRASASLDNSAGKLIRNTNVYFLDGISGGTGFVLPGETVAANVCFTCETTPLPEAWSSVVFEAALADATGQWHYSTQVAGSVPGVSFSGSSPIFDISGTAKNNGPTAMDRIAVRVFVFDQKGKLVGAGVAFSDMVAPGAAVSVRGYGLGQRPAGAITYQVTALGVSYQH